MNIINENAKQELLTEEKKKKITIKDYPFFYTKVMYRKGSLLKYDDYERLLKMDGPYEIADYLKKKTYGKSIDYLSATFPKDILIEASMKYNTAEECRHFINYAVNYPGLHLILNALFLNYYLNNIKYFFLGKINNLDFDKIKPYLIEFGNINFDLFYSLYSTTDDEKFFKVIDIDEKAKIKLKNAYKNKNIVDLQNILSMYYYINLAETFFQISNKREELGNYLNAIIGSKNIINILKLKMIIPNKLSKIQDILKNLIEAKKTDECFSILDKAKWQRNDVKIIKKALDEKDIEKLECLLEKIKLRRAKKIFGVKNISAEVVIGYLALKDIERQNIIFIASGKKYNLSIEEIKKHLVF
ncbi:MAG: hypothetical protein B6U87_01345 [Candidatus Aenigmarchaeota archaeon ex4484_52]|nr:MAG: hypothetical protein B6U87_01345 [Candidatus Aenigmarchaeota archaeon ex4484_52]